jgi:tRNA-Thr(GGU) m(6)t(6)A37 methyltransferase TsaA
MVPSSVTFPATSVFSYDEHGQADVTRGHLARAWRNTMTRVELRVIGRVASSLTDLASAQRQADEGAPEAFLVFHEDMLEGLRNIRTGDEVIVLTWLDRARRDILSVHPRGDRSRPVQGVFSTRSPHRPNPLGLHQVEVTAVDGCRLRVRSLEALDGTPIIDIKPVLSTEVGLR